MKTGARVGNGMKKKVEIKKLKKKLEKKISV